MRLATRKQWLANEAPVCPDLLTGAKTPPAADQWVHEPKLDDWRFVAEIVIGRTSLWTKGCHDWSDRLAELACLPHLGNVVLDGELVVVAPDERGDFELLSAPVRSASGATI